MRTWAYPFRFLAGLVAVGGLVFVLTAAAAPSSARSASRCSPSWHAVPDALQTTEGIAALSPTDAWAISNHRIERWDGGQWSVSWQASDSGRKGSNVELNAVAAAGPSASWAVGWHENKYNKATQVIMSWAGSHWAFDHTPRIAGQTSLSGVVAVAANDVWAVGYEWARHPQPHGTWTFIEHWDGNAWKVVSSPNGGPSTPVETPKSSVKEPLSRSALWAVAAISRDNIWAVGEYDRALRSSAKSKGKYRRVYRVRLLSEHWNGRKWRLTPAPPISRLEAGWNLSGGFNAVAAEPSGEVLALGAIGSAPGKVWWLNGTSWMIDPSWAMYTADAITITSHDDAWVIGSRTANEDLAADHWDGSKWVTTELPADGIAGAAAGSGPDDVWVAGGLTLPGGSLKPVMLHYTC